MQLEIVLARDVKEARNGWDLIGTAVNDCGRAVGLVYRTPQDVLVVALDEPVEPAFKHLEHD